MKSIYADGTAVLSREEMMEVEGGSMLLALGLAVVGLLVTSCTTTTNTTNVYVNSNVTNTSSSTSEDTAEVDVSTEVPIGINK